MPRVSLPPVGLVLIAGLADVGGAHSLAFYLLVLAVPAAAVSALYALDRAVAPEQPWPLHRAWLQAIVLVLVLLSAAVRAPSHGDGAVPRLATSALVGCLAVFVVQVLIAGLPSLRRPRPARVRTAAENR